MTEEQVIQELLPICQRGGLLIRTLCVVLQRSLITPDNVRAAIRNPEVNQTLLHQQLQVKFTRIGETYEAERQSDVPAVRAQAAANVINAIARSLEPEL